MKSPFLVAILAILAVIAGLTGKTVLHPEQDEAVDADAIVLLAGAYRERAPEAALCYRRGEAPLIILTNDGVLNGWSSAYQRNLFQVELAEELLVREGVPRHAIVKLPFRGSGTIYDALAVRLHFTGSTPRRIVLVTSDYHARRAVWTFRHVFRRTEDEINFRTSKGTSSYWGSQVLERIKYFYYIFRFGLLRAEPTLCNADVPLKVQN